MLLARRDLSFLHGPIVGGPGNTQKVRLGRLVLLARDIPLR
jgi:hypothetical protein